MANSKDYKAGYEAAIKALKDMRDGKKNSNGQGGGSSSMQGANTPKLNADDQKKADKNAKNGSGDSQASEKSRKEAAESCGSVGGVMSQEAGAEIARSEGYSDEDCKVKSGASLSQDWKDAAIEACSKNNSPGKGYIVSHFKDYYITSHDWKGELKKYMGRALNNIETDTKLGKKKWLAQGEIKKFDKPSETALSNVIFLIDCSGSVSDKLLQNIISECWTICKKKGIQKVTYCYYDDGIRQMETNDTIKSDGVLDPKMVSKIKAGNARPIADIHGRGGNSEDVVMNELVAMLKKSHKRAQLAMFFTDGYTYAKPVKPREIVNLIWCVYDNNNFETNDGSRVIHLKSEELGK
jgi:predicted metal-dependent peptidase